MSFLSWLFGPRDLPNIYKPRELLLYEYFDGSKMVKADPMVLWKRIMEVSTDLDIDIKVSKSVSKDAPEAHDKVIKKCRRIFNLKPLEDGGLPETETVELFDHFMLFCWSLQKKMNGFQISAEATLVTSNSSPAESPPTPKPSPSGSTETEKPIEEPKSSDSEPVSQSDFCPLPLNTGEQAQTAKPKQ